MFPIWRSRRKKGKLHLLATPKARPEGRRMSILPRSLFGRLVLLLITVVALAVLTSVVLFRHDRAELLVRQFGDTKLAQLQALRAALQSADGPHRRETLQRLNREYKVRIVPEDERPSIGQPALGPMFSDLEERLRANLGPETEVRVAPRLRLLLVRVIAGGDGYWVGFPMPDRPEAEDIPSRALTWTLVVLALLLAAAYVFARFLARPLYELTSAVDYVGRGETPPPLPESGPSEIAAVNRGFNAMLGNLRQIERDRAVLLAGVSHDLRTPLARLRLGIELGTSDDATRSGMVADIEEMDRIIGQFLDFARDDATTSPQLGDLNAIVAACIERYAQSGRTVTFAPGAIPQLSLKSTAISRLVANLVDNALAYGAPPVEVTTSRVGEQVWLDVCDRGDGIPPDQVERLKQPFTRATVARAREDGAAGAGLGLAIVDRIARMHGGTFDLTPRDGGGTVARVALPVPA
jgi:two-component system, OmpR family, osmolarity sensor histidine kinase EnvZ